MATEYNLMLAILAMDTYHREFNSGIKDLKADIGKNIGTATILDKKDSGDSIGFNAFAYNWQGKKVIAYRGTDQGFEFGGLKFYPLNGGGADGGMGAACGLYT